MDEERTGGPGSAQPLRSVLDALTGAGATDPGRALDAAGHPDLPADLVAQAVVSFAEAAPPALAEHLAPFVTAQSPAAVDGHAAAAGADPALGLELLATAPDPGVLDAEADPLLDLDAAATGAATDTHAGAEPDLGFGTGEQETLDARTERAGEDLQEQDGAALADQLPDELAMPGLDDLGADPAALLDGVDVLEQTITEADDVAPDDVPPFD